jgi:hypothetical protein
MVKEQRRFGVPHQLGYLAREPAVGNSDPVELAVGNLDSLNDIHRSSPAEDLAR